MSSKGARDSRISGRCSDLRTTSTARRTRRWSSSCTATSSARTARRRRGSCGACATGSTAGCASCSATSLSMRCTPTRGGRRRRARRRPRRASSGRCTTRSSGCAGSSRSTTSCGRPGRSPGLDAERMRAELESGVHAARVERDVASGTELGVPGTPTFFVNGERHTGAFDAQGADRRARGPRGGLASRQLVEQLGADLGAVDGHGPAGQVDVQRLVDVDLELAAVELRR